MGSGKGPGCAGRLAVSEVSAKLLHLLWPHFLIYTSGITATFWVDNTNKLTAAQTFLPSSSPASHGVGVLWDDLLFLLADRDDNGLPGEILCVCDSKHFTGLKSSNMNKNSRGQALKET